MSGKESGNITYKQMVKMILTNHPEFKNPFNRERFSEYIIARVIGDFMNDPLISGSHDEKLDKAGKIYRVIIESYDSILSEEKELQHV